MTYDQWKTTEPDDDKPEDSYVREVKLRVSHSALLAAAKALITSLDGLLFAGDLSREVTALELAIAAAEEISP